MAKRKPIILALDMQMSSPPVVGRSEPAGGLTARISWARLVQALKESGNVRDEETVRRFEVDEDGITIVLATRAQA
jgi:hypothetical protein